MNNEILDNRNSHLENLKSIYKIGNFEATSTSREAVWCRLLENKRLKQEERNLQKTIQEKVEMKKACTFKPKISQKSREIVNKKKSEGTPKKYN